MPRAIKPSHSRRSADAHTQDQIAHLRELAADPVAQAAAAIDILEHRLDGPAIRSALDVLVQRPTLAARSALLQRFDYYSEDGVRRDAGGYLRAAILQALRPIARPADLPRLEAAAAAYEFLPPGRSEEGALLRSAALVVLTELDPALAALHAVRLLGDPYTSPLSGEPALTAVRVLAAQDQREPLYYYALNPPTAGAPNAVPEVLSECLKSLAGLPASLIPGLIERHAATRTEVVLVGLLDLALAYPGLPAALEFIGRFLREAREPEAAAYRYLTMCLVRSPMPAQRAALARAALVETNPAHLQVLSEALALAAGDPELEAALAAVHRRVRGAHRPLKPRRTPRPPER